MQLGLAGGDGTRLAQHFQVDTLEVIEGDFERYLLLQKIAKRFPLFRLGSVDLQVSKRFVASRHAHSDLFHLSETTASPSGFMTTAHDLSANISKERFNKIQSPILVSMWQEHPPRKQLKMEALLRESFPEQTIHMVSWIQSKIYVLGISQNSLHKIKQRTKELGFQYDSILPDDLRVRSDFDTSAPSLDKPYLKGALNREALLEFAQKGFDPRYRGVDPSFFLPFFALLTALILSLLLIIAPLIPFRRQWQVLSSFAKTKFVVYFACLGMGFMFVEITVIQAIQVSLMHPLWSVSLGIASFLFFAGLGSARAPKWIQTRQNKYNTILLFALIVALNICSYTIMTHLLEHTHELWQQIALVIVCVAPPAFLMGIPFAYGIQTIAQHTPELVARAWAINGSLSVTSAILAQILHPYLGFAMVLYLGLMFYVLAALCLPKVSSSIV